MNRPRVRECFSLRLIRFIGSTHQQQFVNKLLISYSEKIAVSIVISKILN